MECLRCFPLVLFKLISSPCYKHMQAMGCIRSPEEVDLESCNVTYDGMCRLRHMPRLRRDNVDGRMPEDVEKALPLGVLHSQLLTI